MFHYSYIKDDRKTRGDKRPFLQSIGRLNQLKHLVIDLGRSPPPDERDPRPLGQLRRLRQFHLDLDNRARERFDFAWLANLKDLEDLKIETAQSLQPIAGLTKLQSLEIDGRGGPLDTKTLSRLKNLRSLRIYYCPYVDNLDWLSGLTQLRSLNLGTNYQGEVHVTDFSPLKNLKRLESLHLSTENGTSFDVSVLDSTNLTLEKTFIGRGSLSKDAPRLNRGQKGLNLTNCNVHRFDQVPRVVDLVTLELGENHIEDIRGIAAFEQLKSINLSGNPVRDIRPLAGLRHLEFLNLSGCPLEDISAIERAGELKRLDLSNTNVRDLSPLANLGRCPHFLNLSGLMIESLKLPKRRHGSKACRELVQYTGCRSDEDPVGLF